MLDADFKHQASRIRRLFGAFKNRTSLYTDTADQLYWKSETLQMHHLARIPDQPLKRLRHHQPVALGVIGLEAQQHR